MDFSQALVLPFLAFALLVYLITWVFRESLERVFKKLKDSKFWRDYILVVLPSILGVLVGLVAVQFPYPAGWEVLWGRIIFGSFCGMASGTVYRVFKRFLADKEGPPQLALQLAQTDTQSANSEEPKQNGNDSPSI